MAILYVDADSCAVKDEVYRVAARYQVEVVLVSNRWVRVPLEPWIRVQVVRGEPEAADDWIVEHSGPDDLVITADVPLAGRCVERGLRALSPRGRLFDRASVGEALAMRNLAAHLRELGEVTGGPAPFSKRDRSAFLQELDRLLSRLPRRE
jgi:uncharacterized protein YaiI (UPF0178 family)